MKDLLCGEFQSAVEDYLIRHRSILDVLSKLQESGARVNRAASKAVTSCGCIQIQASKQNFPPDIPLTELKAYMDTHLEGALCNECREILEAELGNHLFYLAALCNLFDIDLYDVLLNEHRKLCALGVFNIS